MWPQTEPLKRQGLRLLYWFLIITMSTITKHLLTFVFLLELSDLTVFLLNSQNQTRSRSMSCDLVEWINLFLVLSRENNPPPPPKKIPIRNPESIMMSVVSKDLVVVVQSLSRVCEIREYSLSLRTKRDSHKHCTSYFQHKGGAEWMSTIHCSPEALLFWVFELFWEKWTVEWSEHWISFLYIFFIILCCILYIFLVQCQISPKRKRQFIFYYDNHIYVSIREPLYQTLSSCFTDVLISNLPASLPPLVCWGTLSVRWASLRRCHGYEVSPLKTWHQPWLSPASSSWLKNTHFTHLAQQYFTISTPAKSTTVWIN